MKKAIFVAAILGAALAGCIWGLEATDFQWTGEIGKLKD